MESEEVADEPDKWEELADKYDELADRVERQFEQGGEEDMPNPPMVKPRQKPTKL